MAFSQKACVMLLMSMCVPASGLSLKTASAECPPGSECPTIVTHTSVRSGGRATWNDIVGHKIPTEKDDKKGLELSKVSKGVEMFAAVFTTPDYAERRQAVREAWRVPDNVAYKFIMCENLNSTRKAEASVKLEEETYGDIMRVPCKEADFGDFLPRKLIGAMRAFHEEYSGAKFFFKTDDDTYPQLNSLLDFIKKAEVHPQGHLYAGTFYSGGNVDRNPTSAFYEPEAIYSSDTYPSSAAGGPGYVVDKSMVDFLLKKGIEEKVVPSYLEDKAMAIWIDTYEELKSSTTWLEIQGTDGYGLSHCNYMRGHSDWKSYKLILHHNLKPDHMKCMGQRKDIDCFCHH